MLGCIQRGHVGILTLGKGFPSSPITGRTHGRSYKDQLSKCILLCDVTVAAEPKEMLLSVST
jgi:hypothetical protein